MHVKRAVAIVLLMQLECEFAILTPLKFVYPPPLVSCRMVYDGVISAKDMADMLKAADVAMDKGDKKKKTAIKVVAPKVDVEMA